MKNISLLGADYADVPAVVLPQTGGGTARFDDTTDATAGVGQVLTGYSAYSNGVKINGSLVIQHYYTGSSVPASSLGVDGDIYLQTGG